MAENISQSSVGKLVCWQRQRPRSAGVGDAEGISSLWRQGATAQHPLKSRARIVKKFLQFSFSTSNLSRHDRIRSILDLV